MVHLMGMLPIRKISHDKVALTSYYGKIFISRNSKKVNDYGTWLRNNIMALGLDKENNTVFNMHPGKVFDSLLETPRLYSILAMGFREFNTTFGVDGSMFEWSFDHTKRITYYGEAAMKRFEVDGAILCGRNPLGDLVLMDQHSILYHLTKDGENYHPTVMPEMEEILGLDSFKAPVDYVELKVFSRSIPLGFVLGYILGLEPLIKILGVTPRRVQAGSRVNLDKDEYSITFNDETLIFNKADKAASMILAGFNEFHRQIRSYNVHEFDRRAVYANVLDKGGASARYLREIILMYQLFIDPITEELLINMKEPTDFEGLLFRSRDLLMTDSHPDELDPASMRIKGYERLAGAVYTELVNTIRSHNGRIGKSKYQLDLNPFAVWTAISQDTSKAQVADINPINNLKETEAVTLGGTHGRGSRSMTKHTRIFHRNDMGTISESTVDSSDVGINIQTSADPKFTSLRGISARYDSTTDGPTTVLSTSALLAPGSDRDD